MPFWAEVDPPKPHNLDLKWPIHCSGFGANVFKNTFLNSLFIFKKIFYHMIAFQYQALKQRHREIRDTQTENLKIRIHRALSWLHRAEQAQDADGQFIFLWIAFNAAYAQEIDDNYRTSDKSTFKAFLEKLCALDQNKQLHDLMWKEFPNSIRQLIDKPHVFYYFWEYQRGRIDEYDWRKRFEGAKKAAQYALAQGNTPALLSIVFDRLYMLRNQLIHGGATWGGSINRDQMRDCVQLLGKLVPIIITLMMDNPDALWGEAVYPVVEIA